MDPEQTYIKVDHENEHFLIPIESVSANIYIISLDFLQSFFPSATALYTQNGDVIKGMMIKNGCIQIHDLSLVYKTRFHKGNLIFFKASIIFDMLIF